MAGTRMEITLPNELFEIIEHMSKERNVRKSVIVTEAIEDYVEKKQCKQEKTRFAESDR